MLASSFTPTASAQNGIIVPGLFGNDLTDPDENGVLDASVTSGGSSPGGELNVFALDNVVGDDQFNTKWLAFEPTGTFFQVELDAGPTTLLSYTITSANDAPDRDPFEWQLLGSNDGVNFVEIDFRTGVDFLTRFETQLFTFENDLSFDFYRFDFLTALGAGAPNPGTPNSIQIIEIELFDIDLSPVEGDVDGDGDVDLVDAGILRDNLGNTITGPGMGDLDGDFEVTLLDFRILRDNLPDSVGSANIPEPAAGLLMAFGGVVLAWRRRRLRRPFCLGLAAAMVAVLAGPPASAQQPIATIVTTNTTSANFEQVASFDINSDPDQPFNEGGIARANTVFNNALQVNPNARPDQGRVMVFIEPEQRGTTNSQGGATLNQYTFSHWQYIDRFIDWGGTSDGNIKYPRSGWIDAAHRNGVQIYGNIFLAPEAFGGTRSQVEELIQQAPDGSFPVADRLIEAAEVQGFDGYFLNQEVNLTRGFFGDAAAAERVGQFVDYIQANSDIEILWYDAQNETGRVGFQGQLNSTNDRFFQNNGEVVSDGLFIDFRGGSVNSLNTSRNNAIALGRSPFDLYQGVLLEANGIENPAAVSDFNNAFNGPGGDHRTSAGLFRPDNAGYFAATENGGYDIQAQIDADNQIYVGANADPSNTANPVPGTAWQGIANHVAAKTPLTDDTFVTNFNFGLGTQYAIEGEVNTVGEWNNIGLQDVLPTWRWIVDTDDPTPLEASFDFDEAFHGGNSLRVEGSLDAETSVPLYLAAVPVHDDSRLTLAFKTGEVGASAAEVVVTFEGNEANPVSIPLGASTTADWNQFSADLGAFNGQTIAAIGLRFNDADDPDYQLNVGRLGVLRGEADIPAAPTNATAQSVEIEADVADVRLLWDHSTGYSRDLDNEIYNYNVFRRKADGGRTFLGGASTNAFFVGDLERSNGELVTTLEIEAVGNEFGVSDAEEFAVRWESTAVVTVDRQSGEVTIANPLAGSVNIDGYTITAPNGTLDASQWNSLTDQGIAGFQQDSANNNALGESSPAALLTASDTAVSIGQAFTPRQIAFGVDDEDVAFQYTSDGEVIQGNVVFQGVSTNNLTITIDPVTGAATVHNTSTFDAEIDGYRILSEAGSLNPEGWLSLADQAFAGWEEANPSANQLAELNFTETLTIAAGEAFELGQVFVPGEFQDIVFEFALPNSPLLTLVGNLNFGLPGDFNGDGTVDAADYTVWRDNLGAGFTLADYVDWVANFGTSIPASTLSATAAASVVPEPATLILAAAALGGFARRRDA